MRPPSLIHLLLFLLTLGALFGCNSAEPDHKLKQVMDAGVLKVGSKYGLTSYYQGPDGPRGFEYEMAKGFAEYLGVELEILPFYSIDELLPSLQMQQVDMVAAGLAVTPERKQVFRFSPSYQTITQKLVFKQGNERPRSLNDIAKPLLVTAGSSHSETLSAVQAQYPNFRWQETDDMDEEEMLEQVLTGDLEYAIADSNILAIIRRRHPELSIGFTLDREQHIAWAVSREQDDSLLAAMVDYFGHIRQNGYLSALEDKYFGHVRQFNYVDTRLFIKAAEDVLPQYQGWFMTYAGDLDWRMLAAMAYQESHWDPKAKSSTGVRGIMMLTLPTAKDLGITSRLDPEQSIRGGAQYFSKLLKRIPDRIQYPDRTWFALAAYNVGMGHLEDARILTQRQGGNPDIWVDVKARLPQLRVKRYYKTTRYGYARGNEAVAYVENIRRYYDTLVWLDERKDDQAPELVSNTGQGAKLAK